MTKRLYILLFSIASIGLFSGCYYDNQEELYPGNTCVVGDATMANYYTEQVVPIIQTRCATPGCHVPGGTGPGNFGNYNELKAKVDDGALPYVVFEQRSMPPSGSLGSCDISKLQAWIAAGSPQ